MFLISSTRESTNPIQKIWFCPSWPDFLKKKLKMLGEEVEHSPCNLEVVGLITSGAGYFSILLSSIKIMTSVFDQVPRGGASLLLKRLFLAEQFVVKWACYALNKGFCDLVCLH